MTERGAVSHPVEPALPTLQTARLRLRPWSPADADAIVDMNFDPQVNRYLAGPWDDRQKHHAELLNRIQRSGFPAGLGYWTITERDGPDQFRGYVVLMPLDRRGPEIEVGWRLPVSQWGKGFATEAAGRLVSHAFEALGAPAVLATVHPAHDRSIRVAERLGFTLAAEVASFARTMLRYRRDRQ